MILVLHSLHVYETTTPVKKKYDMNVCICVRTCLLHLSVCGYCLQDEQHFIHAYVHTYKHAYVCY